MEEGKTGGEETEDRYIGGGTEGKRQRSETYEDKRRERYREEKT